MGRHSSRSKLLYLLTHPEPAGGEISSVSYQSPKNAFLASWPKVLTAAIGAAFTAAAVVATAATAALIVIVIVFGVVAAAGGGAG